MSNASLILGCILSLAAVFRSDVVSDWIGDWAGWFAGRRGAASTSTSNH